MNKLNVTVQIMAGGKSTRMGEDKACVTLGGETLLERAVETWKGYGAALQLSVGPAQRACLATEGVLPVPDRYPERGPLGGLHAGLLACQTDRLLLVAVDSPFVTRELADALVQAMDETGTQACVYTLEGRPEPLFGLYHKSCLPVVEDMLAAGENKMGLLLRRVETRCLLGAGKQDFFRNLNTPEELKAAREKFV